MVVVVAKGRTGDSQPKDIKGDPSHPTHRGTHAYALSGPVFPSLGMFYRKAGRVGSSDAKAARRHRNRRAERGTGHFGWDGTKQKRLFAEQSGGADHTVPAV